MGPDKSSNIRIFYMCDPFTKDWLQKLLLNSGVFTCPNKFFVSVSIGKDFVHIN